MDVFWVSGSCLFLFSGDYLVTIEEKNKATYLRAYTNWRYQAVEKTRVGVRLLGHLLRGSSFRGAPKEQMEIIEIPLFEPPLCMACCSVTGENTNTINSLQHAFPNYDALYIHSLNTWVYRQV